jgi:SAM-dependent methyltransferase
MEVIMDTLIFLYNKSTPKKFPIITFAFDSEIEINDLTFETILNSKTTKYFINNEFLKESQLKKLQKNHWEILKLSELNADNLLSFKIINSRSLRNCLRNIDLIMRGNKQLLFRIMLNNNESIENKLFFIKKLLDYAILKGIPMVTTKQTIKTITDKRRRPMTEQESTICNNGERLIPKISHCKAEDTRHKNSYLYFKELILKDKNKNSITILDLGCGVGWGCELLSDIPNSQIIGIDIDEKSIIYADTHYKKSNINYLPISAEECLNNELIYDYIVSRGALEHFDNPLEIIKKLRYRKRLIFDVPYNEPLGQNCYHKWVNIIEETFKEYPNAKFYYEDIKGIIMKEKIGNPNMLMVMLKSKPIKKEKNNHKEVNLNDYLGYKSEDK